MLPRQRNLSYESCCDLFSESPRVPLTTHFLQTPGAKLTHQHSLLPSASPPNRSSVIRSPPGLAVSCPQGGSECWPQTCLSSRAPAWPATRSLVRPPSVPASAPAPWVARSPPTPGSPRWRVRDQEAGCSRGRDAGPGRVEKPRGGTRLSGPGEGTPTRSQPNPGAGARFPEGRLGRARGTARCLTRAPR